MCRWSCSDRIAEETELTRNAAQTCDPGTRPAAKVMGLLHPYRPDTSEHLLAILQSRTIIQGSFLSRGDCRSAGG